MLFFASTAHAITGAICISAKLNGALKLRATGTCKAGKEIQLGTFDGTTLRFTGINVQIVSGAGLTSGPLNGTGNLIVGYNEAGFCTNPSPLGTTCNTTADCSGGGTCNTAFGTVKTGSHNLIVGAAHSYSSYGGLVAGTGNTVSGPDASIAGGFINTASGPWSSVSGGGALTQPATYGWAAGSSTPGNTIQGNFESP